MSEDKTGGSAFPHVTRNGYIGMTLRDYFAAKAMQGMRACPDYTGNTSNEIAKFAYCGDSGAF